MKGAFDEWAESERPARFGGAEKVPAVKQMPRRNHDLVEEMEMARFAPHRRRRGAAWNPFSSLASAVKSGVSAVSNAVTSATDTASKMTEFYNKAKEYAPRVKEALQSDKIPASYKPVATKLVEYMEMVGLGKHKKCPLARHIASECMHRHHSGMYGGASILSIATNAKKVYDWIKDNSAAIHTILKLPQLEPYGGKIEGVMSMVGLGKRPSHRYIDAGVLFMDPVTGHHIIKKGGAWYSNVASNISKGVSAVSKGVSTAQNLYAKAKEYAPAIKDLLTQYGGETGDQVAAKLTKLGLGRHRRGRAGPKPAYATLHGRGDVESSVHAERIKCTNARKMQRLSTQFPMSPNTDAKCKAIGAGRAPNARNAIVKQVMMERGLSLIEASKYVKEHGLYSPSKSGGAYENQSREYIEAMRRAGFYD